MKPALVVVLAPTDEEHANDVIVVGPEGYGRLPELQREYRYVEMWIDQ